MNLRCAIVECASSWVALLSQEGVPWVRANFETLEPEDVSVLIVDRRLQGAEQERVKAYLAGGGAVLGAARFLSSATHMPTRREYVRYLTDDREDPWIELLDVSQVCDIPKEAGVLRTQDNVFGVFAGEVGGGAAILLPFDVSDLWLKEGATNRKFPSPFERLPYERVAVASRSELHRLVHHSLQFLHLHRSVPYVRLRPYPGDTLAMAAFRLDTDRASRRQIAAFYELSQSLSIPFTWFLDTYSHESWLGEFASMQGQEIGVHCYAHKTHKTLADARNDIERAQKLLRDAGIAIGGYAAPYGIWSTTLGETLEGLSVAYSSEFGCGYDGYPFRPEIPGRRFSTLQVPVHPISAGALRRAGYSHERMIRYFAEVISRKRWFDEPLFFYDHPVHECADVAQAILSMVKEGGAIGVTLGQFANWWKTRSLALETLSVQWNHGVVSAYLSEQGGDAQHVSLEITTPKGTGIVPVKKSVRPNEMVMMPRLSMKAQTGLGRTREPDIRSAIGMSFTALLRRFS